VEIVELGKLVFYYSREEILFGSSPSFIPPLSILMILPPPTSPPQCHPLPLICVVVTTTNPFPRAVVVVIDAFPPLSGPPLSGL
jgi:hypothetical protein